MMSSCPSCSWILCTQQIVPAALWSAWIRLCRLYQTQHCIQTLICFLYRRINHAFEQACPLVGWWWHNSSQLFIKSAERWYWLAPCPPNMTWTNVEAVVADHICNENPSRQDDRLIWQWVTIMPSVWASQQGNYPIRHEVQDKIYRENSEVSGLYAPVSQSACTWWIEISCVNSFSPYLGRQGHQDSEGCCKWWDFYTPGRSTIHIF